MPDTEYGCPAYNIRPDPDCCWISFFLYSYSVTKVPIKDPCIDFFSYKFLYVNVDFYVYNTH